MGLNILEEFAAFQRAAGLSDRTINNRDYMLRALVAASGTPLLQVTLRDLRNRLGRGISKGSMQTERDCYKAFYRFAQGEDR